MTEREQCEILNRELSESWEPFSGTGEPGSFQAYLKAGRFGVMGGPGDWQIVHALDGQPATDLRPASLQEALIGAETLFLRAFDPDVRHAAGDRPAA